MVMGETLIEGVCRHDARSPLEALSLWARRRIAVTVAGHTTAAESSAPVIEELARRRIAQNPGEVAGRRRGGLPSASQAARIAIRSARLCILDAGGRGCLY
jgi:hypothetical protein